MDEIELEAARKTHFRTIFLSDIHLGTRGCQAERLLSFLEAHTCDNLYLVGDIIDSWRLRTKLYWPQSHTNVMRQFLTMVKHGTRLTYVTGNHDEFLRGYSDMTLGGIAVVDRAEHETSGGERLLVAHGDQFDIITRYHRWIAFLGDLGYTVLLKLNRHLNELRRKCGYGYWSLSAWIKHRVKKAVSYVSDYEQAVGYECKRQGCDGVICGHIHRAEIREFNGVRYMNCGDWVASCTALVEDGDRGFSILDWSQLADVVPIQPRQSSISDGDRKLKARRSR